MSTKAIDPNIVRKNRTTLIIAFLVFGLPILLAYLSHVTGFWQSRGTVNQGVLITPPVNFDELTISRIGGEQQAFDRETQWWIVYLAPQQCDKACTNSLFQIRQTQTATGPYKKRVSTLFVQHQNSDPAALAWVQEHAPDMVKASVNEQQWNQLMRKAQLDSNHKLSNAGQIYLLDPMGAVFMTYPGEADEQASIKSGKGMLKDLQRVLKLSRIG